MQYFNESYINIPEISFGKKTSSLGNCEDGEQDDATVEKFYQNTVLIPVSKKLKGNFL